MRSKMPLAGLRELNTIRRKSHNAAPRQIFEKYAQGDQIIILRFFLQCFATAGRNRLAVEP